MITKFRRARAVVLAVSLGALWGSASPSFAQLSGSYMAILNESNSSDPAFASDSRRSVVFYDSQDIASGPLFSVFVPFEFGTGTFWEEPNTVTVNPANGDIYLFAFDNVADPPTAWGVDNAATPGDTSDDDTYGDWDMYRINFQTVVDHWTTNFMGRSIRTDAMSPMVDPASPSPTVTDGNSAAEAEDYVTYAIPSPYDAASNGNHLSPNGAHDQSHANAFILNGAIEKIGEVNRNRNGASNFHSPVTAFIDEETLLLMDDARQGKTFVHNVANDYDIRLVERVSASPGAATVTDPMTFTGVDGGFNNGTTESWESRRIAQVLLDADESTSKLSEPQTLAFHDNGAGVRGAWVADRDTTTAIPGVIPIADGANGDDIAFLQLDGSGNSLGYRQFVGGATKFTMSNDPGAGTPDGLGQVSKLFVDSDTGDLIVVEEGYLDAPTGEPAVLRVPVNYDSGGQIALGAWSSRVVLGDDMVPNEDGDSDFKDAGDALRERGYFSAYDSVTDTMYFVSPGVSTDPTLSNSADVYVLDLASGETKAYLNVDDRYALFVSSTSAINGDKVVAFTLDAGLDGDYNGDGFVDAVDYTVWRNNLGAVDESSINDNGDGLNGVDANDYTLWKSQYGEGVPPGAGSGGLGSTPVPEPSCMLLVAVGLAAFGCCRRRI
jgi:hypothetical protein